MDASVNRREYLLYLYGRSSCAPDRARQFKRARRRWRPGRTKLSIRRTFRRYRRRMTSPKSRDRSTGHICTTVRRKNSRGAGCYRCHPPLERVYNEEFSTVKSPTKSPGRTICRTSSPSFDRGRGGGLFRRKTINLHRTKTDSILQNDKTIRRITKRHGSFLFLNPFGMSTRGTLVLFRQDGIDATLCKWGLFATKTTIISNNKNIRVYLFQR